MTKAEKKLNCEYRGHNFNSKGICIFCGKYNVIVLMINDKKQMIQLSRERNVSKL